MSTRFTPGSPFITNKVADVARKVDYKLTFIPLVFVMVRIWGTIMFFCLLACVPDCWQTGHIPAIQWLAILNVSNTGTCIHLLLAQYSGSWNIILLPPPPKKKNIYIYMNFQVSLSALPPTSPNYVLQIRVAIMLSYSGRYNDTVLIVHRTLERSRFQAWSG